VGLNRLSDRGLVVRRRQGDVIIYRPGLSEAEYLSRSIENALSGATPEARRLALAQVVGGPPGDELSGVRPMAGRITGERKAR
jgi:predicted transcriptional regulator